MFPKTAHSKKPTLVLDKLAVTSAESCGIECS
jgi:hypothetical protein